MYMKYVGFSLLALGCLLSISCKKQEKSSSEEEIQLSPTQQEKEEEARNLDAGWEFLFDFEGKGLLDLYEEVPEFKAEVEQRLGDKSELITELAAADARIRREDDFLLMSGTVRHGFPDEEEFHFYSAELVVDVRWERLYAMNYQSDSDRFEYFFEEPSELPPPVQFSLENFYLRPPEQDVSEWDILGFYQLLSYRITNPILATEGDFIIAHHYPYPDKIRPTHSVVSPEEGLIEMGFEDIEGEFSKDIQIQLFELTSEETILGVGGRNTYPGWRGPQEIFHLYKVNQNKRLVDDTQGLYYLLRTAELEFEDHEAFIRFCETYATDSLQP